MSDKIPLDSLSYAELLKLIADAEAKALEKRKADLESAIEAVESELSKWGFTIADLITFLKDTDEQIEGQKAPKARANKGKSVAPKYRNPDNLNETWTGRGRQPKWVVAKLAAGVKLEDFLIRADASAFDEATTE